MARTSKKNTRRAMSGQNKILTRNMEKPWQAGAYGRLSVDRHLREEETIEMQMQIVKDYIGQTEDIELAECYSDLGKTGRNFERGGFERMMEDVRSHKINCIVVKDFSRLGRDYIETGSYIERIFPFMGVRFISVTDGYDSEQSTDAGGTLAVHIKNIVNDFYAKDISERVTASRKLRQEMGQYTGTHAPYGYQIEKTDAYSRLVPCAKNAEIVVRIFDCFLRERSYRKVIRRLYQEHVNPPQVFYETGQVYCEGDTGLREWSATTLKRLLQNPYYVGLLIRNGHGGKYYKKRALTEEWAGNEIVLDHEPLISMDIFQSAAQQIEELHKGYEAHRSDVTVELAENTLEGLVFCGECATGIPRGSTITKNASGERRRFYFFRCTRHNRIDERRCNGKRVAEKELLRIVNEVLTKEALLSGMRIRDMTRRSKAEIDQKRERLSSECEAVHNRIEEMGVWRSSDYIQYKLGKITEEDYLRRRELTGTEELELRRRQSTLEKQMEELARRQRESEQRIHAMMKDKRNEEFDKEYIHAMIHRLYVYADRRVEVILNYRREDHRGRGGVEGAGS